MTEALVGTDTSISDPQMSDDGSKVAFVVSTREWWDDTHYTYTDFNVYVKDFATGQTTVASVGPGGEPLDAPSREINDLRAQLASARESTANTTGQLQAIERLEKEQRELSREAPNYPTR